MTTATGLDARAFALGLAREQVARARGQEAAVRRGDEEALHAMRVALRRLRAVLKLYRGILPASLLERQSDLEAFDEVLGAVRDLDTQVALLSASASPAMSGAAARAQLETQRQNARRRLGSVLGGEEYRALIAALEQACGSTPASTAGPQLREAAAKAVKQAYRRYRRRARRLNTRSTAEDLHEVRKRARRLRYAVEFVRDLYSEPARRFLKAVEEEQDLLGEHQDCVAFIDRMRQCRPTADFPVTFREELIGRRARRMAELREGLAGALARVEAEWRALKAGL